MRHKYWVRISLGISLIIGNLYLWLFRSIEPPIIRNSAQSIQLERPQEVILSSPSSSKIFVSEESSASLSEPNQVLVPASIALKYLQVPGSSSQWGIFKLALLSTNVSDFVHMFVLKKEQASIVTNATESTSRDLAAYIQSNKMITAGSDETPECRIIIPRILLIQRQENYIKTLQAGGIDTKTSRVLATALFGEDIKGINSVLQYAISKNGVEIRLFDGVTGSWTTTQTFSSGVTDYQMFFN